MIITQSDIKIVLCPKYNMLFERVKNILVKQDYLSLENI